MGASPAASAGPLRVVPTAVVAPGVGPRGTTGGRTPATVAAPQFAGLSRIEQHRLVKAAVKPRFDDGSVHALSVKTRPA